jgi:hypothetical protein
MSFIQVLLVRPLQLVTRKRISRILTGIGWPHDFPVRRKIMSGSTFTPPYATPPLGLNGAPTMAFIQPLPQPILQLTFPTAVQLLAESLAAAGLPNTNTSATSGAGSTEPTIATTTGALASLDTSQGSFVLPFDFA